MIEIYQLQQLLAFAQYGTLSKAAEELNITQPALSRNMKKIEEEIGVTLFERRANHLGLNDSGKLTVELARSIVQSTEELVKRVQAYDRSQHLISVGLCAPAPMWKLTPLLSNRFPDMTVQSEIKGEDVLIEGLKKGGYQLIVLPYEPDDKDLFSVMCEREELQFSLPKSHRFADRESLGFSELDGENMLLMSDIGFWYHITVKKLPNSRFLKQTNRHDFTELVQSSILPSFTTDLAKRYYQMNTDRVDIPITDNEAKVSFYLACRKKEKQRFSALLSSARIE